MSDPAATSEPMPPKLYPQQVCFVVVDVDAAVAYCEKRFGWGPFHQFKVPVEAARYRDWSGQKLTEVALGMAGGVQVELLRVHYGQDTTADYQAAYGTGFQHIGIACRSRDIALSYLTSLGAQVNELNEYPGVRFAFVDAPTGPGMLEILQPTAAMEADQGLTSSRQTDSTSKRLFDVDRATIVTRDIDAALSFYSPVFSWVKSATTAATLRYGNKETRVHRYIGRAGALELEILEPQSADDNPYSQHLVRGNHGLIHAGGICDAPPEDMAMHGEWVDTGEHFALYNWPGGEHSLQLRSSN